MTVQQQMEDVAVPPPMKRGCLSSSLIDVLASEELVTEILIRLTLKQANLCKCVSKAWLRYLTSHYFASRYILHNARHGDGGGGGFALFYYKTIKDKMRRLARTNSNHQFPPASTWTAWRILASCEGLVLCSTSYFHQSVYYVCNPLTATFVALPLPPTSDLFLRVRFGLICYPDHPQAGTDFSITPTGFRVVRIPEFQTRDSFPYVNLEVFSSETGQWTSLVISCSESKFRSCPSIQCSRALVCNGLLHWHRLNSHGIFAYDPKTNHHKIVPLPKEHSFVAPTTTMLGVCRGRLRYAVHDIYSGIFMIWELQDYYSKDDDSWCLLQSFNQKDCPQFNRFKRGDFFVSILAFHPLDQDVLYVGFLGRAFEFNIRTKNLEPICSSSPGVEYEADFLPYVLPLWQIPVPRLL